MDPGVFDNVLPVDGVCVAQELVAVNIHTTIQDLCGDETEEIEDRVSIWEKVVSTLKKKKEKIFIFNNILWKVLSRLDFSRDFNFTWV